MRGERVARVKEMEEREIPTVDANFISLKRYQVAYTVWGRVVQVRILVGRPSFRMRPANFKIQLLIEK